MQKSSALGIKDPKPLLDENTSPPQLLDQIAERREGSRIGVLHHLLPDQPTRYIPTEPP